MRDKKIELVVALMQYRQVSFIKSSFGAFYYFCHGVPCKNCPQTWFCEKHFSKKTPTINQEQYEYLREFKPEYFI